MSELSVFVDESGDTGANTKRHIVSFVFHDQSQPIDNDIARLAGQLRDIGFPLEKAIHTGPLVRREDEYLNMSVEERKRILSRLHAFFLDVDVRYATFAYLKRELGAREPGEIAPLLQARLTRDIELFLHEQLAYFTGFDHVIVYYDNGQDVVGRAVREAFDSALFGVEFRRVQPSGYRLFQAADLVCTLELLRCKADAGELSRGELGFFGSVGRLRKNYLRQIARLRLG